MTDYPIADLPVGSGRLGIAPMPGRGGAYQADLTAILRWGAGLVLTMTTSRELLRLGAESLGNDLALAGVLWRHLPIRDFGAPEPDVVRDWHEVSETSHGILEKEGRVLAHCYGGCGRSGMAVLRLMVEAGEAPDAALQRLREVRPCAVETGAQLEWASEPNRKAHP